VVIEEREPALGKKFMDVSPAFASAPTTLPIILRSRVKLPISSKWDDSGLVEVSDLLDPGDPPVAAEEDDVRVEGEKLLLVESHSETGAEKFLSSGISSETKRP